MKIEDEELLSEARSIVSSNTEKTRSNESDLICECKCITVGDIREFIKEKNISLDLEELKSGLTLGSGCSTCTKNFDDWKSKI